ncbi:MAG: HlyD family efflux transporter periplasmic adaptor subunit [Planctomycetaceae bacterium]|nr:HlyD family efflux transporter periplasmic adaptor subunit [Planctomycetaceae bacterium]
MWNASALLNSLGLASEEEEGAGEFITEPVIQGPFLVNLNVQGYLDSQRNATLSCQVEGTTTIITLVPEGTLAKEGDVLCELDSSQFKEKAKQQEITVTQAEAALIQAKEQLEIQRNQNDSDIAAAELKWKLAQLDLTKYEQGEFPQQKKQLEGTVVLNKEELVRAEENLAFIREQVKKGYRNQNDLESARLTVQQAELKLSGSEEELKVLTKFTFTRTIEELKANAAEFERELQRTKLKAESAVAQYEKDVDARKLTAEVEREQYERLLKQIDACILRAPQDGEVVYANLQGSRRGGEQVNIEEGATVRERQAIINLPDVTKMKVDCRIHESLIGDVRVGLSCRIRMDAHPDKFFNGKVTQVSSVPMTGNWPNTDLREYATEIQLVDDIERIRELRPGLTAQVEILIDNRPDVLQIPVQAVVGVSDRHIAYVMKQGVPERRDLVIGDSNQTHIEVSEGVKAGEKVILNPRSRFADEIGQLEAKWNTEREKKDGETIKVTPGQETPRGPSGPGGPGGGAPGAGGGGRPDPQAFFNRMDANSDGKITSDETQGPLKEKFSEIDTDGNGEISLEEFKAGASKLRPPGGGGGGAPGGGGGGPRP